MGVFAKLFLHYFIICSVQKRLSFTLGTTFIFITFSVSFVLNTGFAVYWCAIIYLFGRYIVRLLETIG